MKVIGKHKIEPDKQRRTSPPEVFGARSLLLAADLERPAP